MKDETKRIIFYSTLILITLLVGVFIGKCTGGQMKDPLIECMKSTRGSSWFSDDAVKDSKVLDSCARYHRQTLVDLYLYDPILDKDGNVIGRKLKQTIKGERKYKKAEVLDYIESGRFGRD